MNFARRKNSNLGSCRKQITRLVLLAVFFVFSVHAQPTAAPEYNLKASYLAAFTRYTTWPTNILADQKTPIVIGILGKNPFGSILASTAARETKSQHQLIIRELADVKEAAGCQLVFISKTEAAHEAAWLAQLKDKPVLTVGETEQSLENGAVLQFVILDDGHVRFNADWLAIQKSGLKISSEMMRSAKTIAHAPNTPL